MKIFVVTAFLGLAVAITGAVSAQASPLAGYPSWAQDAFTTNT